MVGGVEGALIGVALRKLAPLGLAGLVLAFAALGVLLSRPAARALPPAGTDTVFVTAEVTITSRLGTEIVHLTGLATIEREDQHLEDGRQVVDLQITDLTLTGTSLVGPVTVAESSTATTGQIRSVNLNPSEYPATSFFDVFFDLTMPISGFRSAPLYHNETAIHLESVSNIDEWPPYGLEYRAEPEAPTGSYCSPSAVPPGLGGIPVFPPTGWEYPETAQTCITKVSVVMSVPPTATPTITPCSPTCTPTPTSTPPSGTPTFSPPTPTRTPGPTGPEDTVLSIARGDPSEYHPASLLSRAPGGGPVPVSGNDDFANAWNAGSLNFVGMENTLGFTTEPGEPLTVAPDPVPPEFCISTGPNYKGATAWFRFTATASGSAVIDTNGSSYDTVLAIYTGSALDALTLVGCDDDSGSGLQSEVNFTAVAGTTYYAQAGGFSGGTGSLRLNVIGPGGAGSAGLRVVIACAGLGLSATGCDSGADGTQDDLDALSFGNDMGAGSSAFLFSVGRGSLGVAGTGVAQQTGCSPHQPHADEFSSARNGANVLVLDGDGVENGCPSATGLGLIEQPDSDNLDAISGDPPAAIDHDNDGTLDEVVFFSLNAGSPSLSSLGRGPADILWSVGFQPGLYASAAQLGLLPGDDIDGLCLADRGSSAVYEPALDTVLFSLVPGSPSLDGLGASGATLLAPGPKTIVRPWELGLQWTDDVDALRCYDAAGADATIPVDDVWFCDSSFQDGVCDTTIREGDTVTWDFTGSVLPHTSTECGTSCDSPVPSGQALWNSGSLGGGNGGTFSFTFDTPGTYLYFCAIHPEIQRGRIIVQGTGPATPTPTPVRNYGDANKDGSINPIDAALVLQHSAGLLPSINQNADANANGQVNAIDATLILQYVAGLLDSLPP